ncbi:MAG TPA: ATP-binding protein, partial [Ktedonobacterales bacterium]
WVSADPERLKEVLDNVIGNAIKYSPHGGSVRIGCVVEGGTENGALQVNAAEPSRESSQMVLDALDADRRGPVEDGALALTPLLAEEERLTLAARAVAVADQPTAQMSALPASASQRGANGALRVEQSADSSTTHSIDGYATITVTDEGMGIPTAERDRLFGRFARLDAARSSQIRGTGLGLYICRQVMEAMGGAIWLQDSAPGRGSTFALAVPLATPQSRDE